MPLPKGLSLLKGGARAGEAVAEEGASVGFTESLDYRETFFEKNPGLRGEVIVHHAIEQQVLAKYPELFTEGEIHSIENLRGIPKPINSDIHLSQIRKMWNRFYRSVPNPTREQILDKESEIDRLFGGQFTPSK